MKLLFKHVQYIPTTYLFHKLKFYFTVSLQTNCLSHRMCTAMPFQKDKKFYWKKEKISKPFQYVTDCVVFKGNLKTPVLMQWN